MDEIFYTPVAIVEDHASQSDVERLSKTENLIVADRSSMNTDTLKLQLQCGSASNEHFSDSDLLLGETVYSRTYTAIPMQDDQSETHVGSQITSYLNLTNTILGSGMLAMPSAFAATGLIGGIVLVLWCAVCSLMGLVLLSRVAARIGRTSSFYNCSNITFPASAILIDLAIAIKCFGVSISYLVIVGELMPQVIAGFIPSYPMDSVYVTK